MKLLIISDMPHYCKDGGIFGWGPTVEEINYLSTLFTDVRHLGCLYSGSAPNSFLPYLTENITFIPLPPSGGSSIQAKLGILLRIPHYIIKIVKELRKADVVHLRCPANIPLIGLLVLMGRRKPVYRWVKYAGNWNVDSTYPFFYRLQRGLLNSSLCKCVVTINGNWVGQKPFIHSIDNPSLTKIEYDLAKKEAHSKQMTLPVRLIFVGALNDHKGVGRLLQIAFRLKQKGLPFTLDVLGDGPERGKYEMLSTENGLNNQIAFHGWISKNDLGKYYKNAHINILPSISEGWPKVLSEGMAYGVVALASAVSSIPQVLEETKAGLAISPFDIDAFVEAIIAYSKNSLHWKTASLNGIEAAERFTYQRYLEAVRDIFKKKWHIELTARQP